ncbi:unnamed protein product [Clonostachys rosea]|uniref:Alpha/beta hydrolase fold-3 domain-containing protein n=1 Tax=Bionectria ochroleuca TaxID=29856 RepID=A0ABY6V2B5_BIOOC|nr:unnamed protein product [Clonostachys rosea]
MILGPVTLLDCLVFLIFLAPQLLIQVGLCQTVHVALKALPFLIFQLPVQLIQERYYTPTSLKPGFVQSATLFEDLVIRCVRYAFQSIPSNVSRVFFDKWVALPFLRWRMLRHGYVRSPVYWKEERYGQLTGCKGNESFSGLWIKHRPEHPPDFVLYYIHGGGFSLGSAAFYLEFLLAWHHLLVEAGYRNPAIFALDYTLVPDDVYPRQLNEVTWGYKLVLKTAGDPSKVCVAGDSAGGALVLSLLQELGTQRGKKENGNAGKPLSNGGLSKDLSTLPLPQLATLISPWVTLMTQLHSPSPTDFLNRESLWKYAHEYAGDAMIHQHPASPGSCVDGDVWRAASPGGGYYVIYGEDEVFAPNIEDFVRQQTKMGIEIGSLNIPAGIHAWPVVSLFLSSYTERRLAGLQTLVREVKQRMSGKVEGQEMGEKSD